MRNSIDDRCPSPTARRLMTKRSEPFASTALIRRRHDRWIEQRRRLDRVFVREIGPDQQAALGRHRGGIRDVRRQRIELPLEHLPKMPMTPVESLHDRRVQRCHFGLGNRQDPRHQQVSTRLARQQSFLAGKIGLGEHAAGVG